MTGGGPPHAAIERCRAEHWPAVERLIRDTVREISPPGSLLVEMCDYHMETGGKRLRAIIPLLAAPTLGLDPLRVRPFAAACETLHNATLVHDDLQDGDTHRRDRETVWKRWSPAQAINLGDAMFYYAVALVGRLEFPAEIRAAVTHLAIERTIRVIDGQAREFLLKEDPAPSVERYLRVVEGKTSGLFEVPLVGAAILAGAPPGAVAALETAARHLGVVFQIQDDVLDLYGAKGRGMRGSDIAEGKVSVLAAHCLASSDPARAAKLRAILAKPRDETTERDVEEADALFRAAGSLRFALDEIGRRERAVREAADLRSNPALHDLLVGLADAFLEPIRSVVG